MYRSLFIRTLTPLIIFMIAVFVPANGQRQTTKTRSQSFSIVFSKIGDAPLQGNVIPVSGSSARDDQYSVRRREIVSGKLVGSAPRGLNLHPLVRQDGRDRWEVQPAALKSSSGSNDSEWKAEVSFGAQTDVGEIFELRMVASRDPLPVGPVPFDILARNALSMSEVVRVRRRIDGASVWIAYINNSPVHGNELIDVKLQAPVEVRARALPHDAVIGVAVHPVKPWTDRHWVMDESVMSNGGNITAHFGREGMDEFDEFEVIAFVTTPDRFPPHAVGIPQGEWERIERGFLVKSRMVKAIRWETEFSILEIGGRRINPRSTLQVDQQSDVYGAVGKPLGQNEKVWIICLPKGGEPWVAGWTDELHSSGRWVVNAAQLGREGQSRTVDVVAVIAADDPTRVNPKDLWRWIYQTRRPLKTVRVAVK